MGACENCGGERETTETCACGEAQAHPMSAAVNALFDHPALRQASPEAWPPATAEPAFELTAPAAETAPVTASADEAPIQSGDATNVEPSLPYDEPATGTESWPVGALEFERALLREMRPDFERADETPVEGWHEREPEPAHREYPSDDAVPGDTLASGDLDRDELQSDPPPTVPVAAEAIARDDVASGAFAADDIVSDPLVSAAAFADAPPSTRTADDGISGRFDDFSEAEPLVPGIHVPPPAIGAAPQQRGLAFGARELGIVGVALVVGAVGTFSLLKPSSSSAAPATPATATRPARVATPAPKPVRTTPRHTWSSANRDWVGAQRHAVALEVVAENKVQTWGQTAQPVLVVRCLDHRIESFVFIASAAKLEAKDDRHSVHYQFDESPAVDDRWADSDEHDALFAPDGAAFTKQVQQASALHFSYTPHNAPPVTANFNVAGLSDAMLTEKPCAAK